MTEDELAELILDCPTLYHMAEEGAWGKISDIGLLSTSALLDLYKINGEERISIEKRHRPKSIDIREESLVVARIRDQIPMSDDGLRRALPNNLPPSAWYELLNAKTFFWLTEDRLSRLLNARTYRDQVHDVLEVDTRSLIAAYRDSIWLCPINSGCTKPYPHPRDQSTFQRIGTYPYASWKLKRRAGERVVELAVDHSVPDIVRFTTRVTRRKGAEIQDVLWQA